MDSPNSPSSTSPSSKSPGSLPPSSVPQPATRDSQLASPTPVSKNSSTSFTQLPKHSRVALIGNPNTGKSSLFNALCGMSTRVGNFPGVTVEKKVGYWTSPNQESIEVIDLPGTYSLAARSADESVVVDTLLGLAQAGENPSKLDPPPDCIIVVVDATMIERNLYLFSQVRELGIPMLLVLNMWDRVASEQIAIHLPDLEAALGVPILTAVASRRKGITEIQRSVEQLCQGLSSKPIATNIATSIFPDEFNQEVAIVRTWLTERGHSIHSFEAQRLIIDVDGPLEKRWIGIVGLKLSQQLATTRKRLDEANLSVPKMEPKLRHEWVQRTIADSVTRSSHSVITMSDRIDRLLTHQAWGLLFLISVLFFVFQAVFASIGTGWLSELIEQGCQHVADYVSAWIPPGALRSLINDGVIGGVGGVLVFIPQIAVLFMLIAILEDCGYMARVALVMDKWMSYLGLSGRAFLPLMTSFGCAVPGIMATRTIACTRDRMVTILVAPLMSCSARLPVYTLMIVTFIPSITYANGWISLQGLLFLAMYALGAVVAIPIAWFLKKWVFPGAPSPFVLEMPTYKWPSWRVVFQQVADQVKSFVVRAGTLIFCTSILLWAAAYFPTNHAQENRLVAQLESIDAEQTNASTDDLRSQINAMRATAIEQSFLGRFGRSIEPVFHAVGWDWKIGVGVLASFPAREVIIATLGTIYSLGADVDEESDSLAKQMSASRWPDGRPVFTWVTALSIMVFFALCAQCAATLVTIRRETQSWFWPSFTFVYMTTLAYLAAMLVFRIGSLFLG